MKCLREGLFGKVFLPDKEVLRKKLSVLPYVWEGVREWSSKRMLQQPHCGGQRQKAHVLRRQGDGHLSDSCQLSFFLTLDFSSGHNPRVLGSLDLCPFPHHTHFFALSLKKKKKKKKNKEKSSDFSDTLITLAPFNYTPVIME